MSRSRVEFGESEYIRELPRRGPPVREYDDVDFRARDRVPHFLREENRRPEPGPLVLRQREIETVERPRQRSPSPVYRERIVERARSVSPGRRRVDQDVRIRRVVREHSRGPGPERIHFVEASRSRSSSRSSSPTPVRERIRIVEREKERAPSPAPPPPPAPVIKGPTIEREVITHYRDIDHGMVVARPPSPPPPPVRHRDTEIDIYTSRGETEVDIRKHAHSANRGRSTSRERVSRRHMWSDDALVETDRKHLHVDIERRRSVSRGRRAHSAAPPRIDYDDEAYEIVDQVTSRGKMGEAWHGKTKDWAIIDVPPGTERVRMDGAGGAAAEVTWSKYSGSRRAKFIPERDERSSVVSSSTSISEARGRDREQRLSVQIIDKDGRGPSRDRGVEIEKVVDRRIAVRTGSNPPPPRRNAMWTEISKDLVIREAIQEMGYEFEETEAHYYIIDFLAHDDVVRLVDHSERIRAARKDRAREIQWEREWRDDWDHRNHHHHHKHRISVDRLDDERIVEREVVYDSRHPGRGYRH